MDQAHPWPSPIAVSSVWKTYCSHYHQQRKRNWCYFHFTFFFVLVSLKHLSDMSCWAVQVCFSAKRHVKNNFRGCFLCRRQPFDGNALSPSGVTKPLGCVTNSNHMTAEDMHQNSEGKNWFSIIASKTIRRSRCAALKQVPSGYCKPPSQIVKLSYIVSMRFILLVPTEKRSLDY
jgi:hypothetical protein